MTHTTKHTPGPLKAVQIIIENSPCTWAVQRKNIREQWGKPSVATYIDNEADARLFAAAPAMYEALREAQELIRSLVAEEMIHSSELQRVGNCQANMWQALSQAEGRHHE